MASDDENVELTPAGITYTLTAHNYAELKRTQLIFSEVHPKPTRVTVRQADSFLQIGDRYPDFEMVLEYEGFVMTPTPPGLDKLIQAVRSHHLESVCLAIKEFVTDGTNAYIPPWQSAAWSRSDTYFQDQGCESFWSSIELESKKLLDAGEFENDEFPSAEKYTMGAIMGETTKMLRHYPLTTKSISRLSQYPSLEYKFQDGRTHIWTNLEVVVKLSFDKILAEHEVRVLRLGLPCLPKLIDAWVSEDEVFIVMEHGGTTLNQKYIFDVAIPQDVRQQQLEIKEVLKTHGLEHLDDHMNNYVINEEGKLTMIDAEVIVDSADQAAYTGKDSSHTYRFAKSYYAKINQMQSFFR